MVYLVNGDYAGGDTDSNSQIIVFSAGSITGGTFSGTVWNYYRTISGGTFSGMSITMAQSPAGHSREL